MNVQHRNFVDHFGYMLETSRSASGDNGRGDCVARTVLAAIIYQEPRFIDAIVPNFNTFMVLEIWKPFRHPEDTRFEDFSRDHTIWFVIWLKYFHPDKIDLCLKIPKRISPKFKQSLDMPFWFRALAKNRWIDNFLYWVIAGLLIRFASNWNRLLRWQAGIVSEDYRLFKATPEVNLNRRERFARKNSIPSYTADTQAFMVKCLSDGWFKHRLTKRVLSLIEKTNYHIRLLIDDVFTIEEFREIQHYTGMDGLRMSRRMDKTTDIDLNALSGPQPPYNMDVDFLKCNMDHA